MCFHKGLKGKHGLRGADKGNPYLDRRYGDPRAMAPMGNPDLDCSYGDPRAMKPMGNPYVD